MPAWLAVAIGILALGVAADSALRGLYLFAVRWRSRASELQAPVEPGAPLAVIVPAHDEAAIIAATIQQAQQYLGPADVVFVVADNCTDATAEVARTAGGRVYERHDLTRPGKGAALAWLVETAWEELSRFDGLVILDADTRVSSGSFDAIRATLREGAEAGQGFVQPIGAESSRTSTLAGYSELLSQWMDDATRSHLGWPVPLRGTGMAFRPEVLREFAPLLRTRVEDVEMSLLLATHGVHVHFIPQAVIFDPKPIDLSRAARQRARWLQGQRHVWRLYWLDILRLLATGGPAAWSLLQALLFKPKSLAFVAKAVLLAGFLLLPLQPLAPRSALVITLTLAVAIDLVYYGMGLLFAEQPGAYASTLLQAPLYPLMWVRALAISVFSRERWFRTRE